MSDRRLGSTGFRSNHSQNDKGPKHDRFGGSRVAGAKGQTTKALSSAMMEEDEPTEEELATLRKVSDHLPWSAFIVAMVELCERFTYYGLSGPFQNYIQYHPHDTPIRGGIGTALQSRTVRLDSGTEHSQGWAKLGRQHSQTVSAWSSFRSRTWLIKAYYSLHVLVLRMVLFKTYWNVKLLNTNLLTGNASSWCHSLGSVPRQV